MKNPRFSLNGDGRHHESADVAEADVVQSLNERYDELNKLWNDAEKRLKRFPIPVDVEYRFKETPCTPYSPDPDEPVEEHYLGYVKHLNGWRLCYGCTCTFHGGYDHQWKPIAECPLDIRIEAIAHVEKLLQAVIEAAKNCVPKLDQAIADLRRKLGEM